GQGSTAAAGGQGDAGPAAGGSPGGTAGGGGGETGREREYGRLRCPRCPWAHGNSLRTDVWGAAHPVTASHHPSTVRYLNITRSTRGAQNADLPNAPAISWPQFGRRASR